MGLQIHIAGSKRSGKTAIAQILAKRLRALEIKAVVLDIDAVRRSIFGEADKTARIGSKENVNFHAWAHRALFEVAIPAVLRSGGVPIMVATHSNRINYNCAMEVARENDATLKFVILETPSIEEVARRAREDNCFLSDTCDLDDPDQRRAYLESLARLEESYGQGFNEPYLRVPQDVPERMADVILSYVLS